ncbi:mitochondrial import inner membrane translocase subunit TIM44-like isoform X2 [Halichondria panicea]|uniref:mitochondrial import inner membrane translocase subunit TIM44-like isoform X2 n=1 Tax=Halichondria panicea TaxID=6063 RepID=UPI00312B5E76
MSSLLSRAYSHLHRTPITHKTPFLTLRTCFYLSLSPKRPVLLSKRCYSTVLRRPPTTGQGRWYSGGGASSGGGGRKGFFRNFIENIRKGVNQNREMQESLKGFHEERDKLQKSHVMQQAKEKAAEATTKVFEYGAKGLEITKQGYSQVIENTAKAVKTAAETEVGKKGKDIGSQLAEGAQKTATIVGQQAEELAKTDVGQSVQKGAEIVKEDLIDDILKESAPYQAPDKIQTRSEMASDYAGSNTQEQTTISPNEQVKEVTLTRHSKWKEGWDKLRENNPVSNAMYNFKMKYDESDNLVIRASRAVTDRLGDAFGGVVTQSDMAEALAEIYKIDPSFTREDFMKQCQFEIIPTVLEAFLRGDSGVLKDWCYEPAFNVLSVIVKQRDEPGVKTESKVLEVRDVDALTDS